MGGAMPVLLNCTICGKEISRPPSHAARTKEPMCSYECNGIRRGQEWATHGHKGRAGWTEASWESYQKNMSGAKNPAWKGGITYKRPKGNHKGARYVRAPKWAAAMARKDGYIMEHRLVMVQLTGRLLTRTECVHHRDHDPLNNEPSNLELWPTNRDHKMGEVGRFVEGVANRLSLAA